MKTLSMGQCLLAGLVGLSSAANVTASDDGKNWVQSHDFTISALVVLPDHLDAYTESGLNLLLGWEHVGGIYSEAALQNLPWIIHGVHKKDLTAYHAETDPIERQQILDALNASIAQEQDTTTDLITTYAGNQGLLLWDEPKPDELEFLEASVQWAQSEHPSKLTLSNLNAYNTAAGGCGGDPGIGYDYSDHVSATIATGIDIIGADAYPYFDSASATSTYLHCRFYATLESVRNRARAADIPYWFFAQSSDEGAYRLPSQSDLRLSMFAPLAYGFTGLQFYMYWHPQSNNIIKQDRLTSTPPDTDYEFNHYVQDASAEVARLGRTLRLLTSRLVRHVRSQSLTPLPWGTVEFEGTISNPVGGITSIEIATPAASNNGLIGFFEDEYHHNYFMLVNTKRAADTSAWDTRLEFTLHLDPSVTSLYKMNRDTGAIESVPITNNEAALTILGGTGELFKVNSSSFVGLD